MSKLKSIELFAGAGGLALGLSRSGFMPLKIVEFNKYCRATLKLNQTRHNGPSHDWPREIDCDVRDQDYSPLESKVDLVSGGPPCQPFSMGGRHKAQADTRDMFLEAVRAVRETRTNAFMFENVKGLTRESFSNYFEYIRLQLAHPHLISKLDENWSDHLVRLQRHHTSHRESSDDYRVVTRVMNAADYGVPQQRHRVFFVGIRADLRREYAFPRPTHSRLALIQSIASGEYTEKVGITGNSLSVGPQARRAIKRASCGNTDPINSLPWVTTREALMDIPEPKDNGVEGWLNHFRRYGAKVYPGHTGSDLDYPAKTLKAGVHGVPGGENMLRNANGRVRYFSVRESARIQTFPDDYEITGSWTEAMRQLGNAVPVKLAEVVARNLSQTLETV